MNNHVHVFLIIAISDPSTVSRIKHGGTRSFHENNPHTIEISDHKSYDRKISQFRVEKLPNSFKEIDVRFELRDRSTIWWLETTESVIR